MEHQTEIQITVSIVKAFTFAKFTRLNIALAIARAEKNILSPAAFQHSSGNSDVFAEIAVACQFFPMLVPFKMGFHLVFHILQKGVNRQSVAAVPVQRLGGLALGADGFHHTDAVDMPNQRGFPINAFDNAFNGFVCRHLVAEFFTTDFGNGVGK